MRKEILENLDISKIKAADEGSEPLYLAEHGGRDVKKTGITKCYKGLEEVESHSRQHPEDEMSDKRKNLLANSGTSS